MIRLPFVPGCVEWVYKQGAVKAKLAISDRNSSFVHIYDARSGSNESIVSREVSSCFNYNMKLNSAVANIACKWIVMSNIFWADTPGANKIYEVQPWIRYCDFCRWQRNHWVLESCFTWVPRNWVSVSCRNLLHFSSQILEGSFLFLVETCVSSLLVTRSFMWMRWSIWDAHLDGPYHSQFFVSYLLNAVDVRIVYKSLFGLWMISSVLSFI